MEAQPVGAEEVEAGDEAQPYEEEKVNAGGLIPESKIERPAEQYYE